MDSSHSAPATTPAKAQSVLVLQGGGALGSYQAGAYQALCHHDFEPEWIAGISIGAINAAIIAGNSRATRLGKLREFWERITDRKVWHYTPDGDVYRQMRNVASSIGISMISSRNRLPPLARSK